MADGLWTMACDTLGADFNPWGGHSPLPWIATLRVIDSLRIVESDDLRGGTTKQTTHEVYGMVSNLNPVLKFHPWIASCLAMTQSGSQARSGCGTPPPFGHPLSDLKTMACFISSFRVSVFARIGNVELLADFHTSNVVKVWMTRNGRHDPVFLIQEQTVAAAFPDKGAAVLVEECNKLLSFHAIASFR